MSFVEFVASIEGAEGPPAGLGAALEGLWWDARGDWEKAHARAQADVSRAGAWVHAYLHRKEGDPGNAGYWYAHAGRSRPADDVSLRAEWEQIARALLEGQAETAR